MAKTRAMRKLSASRKKSYAKRVRSSPCRSKGPAVCRSMKACKYTKGKKRSYCRKASNSKRTRGGSGCGSHKKKNKGGSGCGSHKKKYRGGYFGSSLSPLGLKESSMVQTLPESQLKLIEPKGFTPNNGIGAAALGAS
jgi:hypothetical protein